MKRVLVIIVAFLAWSISLQHSVMARQSDSGAYKRAKAAAKASTIKTSTSAATSGLVKVESDPVSGITEYRLQSNKLQVLLAERHSTPIVTVMVVYHVGSRNEAVGYTGSTHFLEHMMFRGTKSHDPLKGTGIDDVLKPIGGLNNATTFYDRTNYYEMVPAKYLSTCLELEADRMRNALLRQSDRDAEMTVVRNELERNEDDPDRLLDWSVFAHSYLAHPYHHPVIGWRSDVEKVPLSRLRKFYNDFYYPDNATLVVIGDFKTTDALRDISKYFSKVPASTNHYPPVYTVEPPQEGQRRFTVQRGSDLPKVMMGFHAPPAVQKDTYALEVAASLLGDERKQSSRLYKALIDTNLASNCYAYNSGLRDPSLFALFATANPGVKSEKLETVFEDQLRRLATEPATDEELDKAKKSVWKRRKLEAADPMGMASQLAEAIAVADWHWWLDLDGNIKAVTKADVQRVARKYFEKKNETVGYYYPVENVEDRKPSEPAKPAGLHDNGQLVRNGGPAGSSLQLKENSAVTASTAAVTQKSSIASQVQKKVLSNGLTVLVMPVKGSGVVSVAGKVRAGAYFHPPDVLSVPELTADMLDKGSAHWTKDALARQLELMGTSLDFSSDHFFLNFESDIVREDLSAFLGLVSDVIQNPLFPEDELDKAKKQRASAIQSAMADTGSVAFNTFYNSLYKPDCVYFHKTFAEQLEELPKADVEKLRSFHGSYISPQNMVLTIVGDIDAGEAFLQAEKNFGNWKGASAATFNVSECSATLASARKLTKQMVDKANVAVLMGAPASVSIKSKDFYAAQLANAALGHDTLSSRLADVRNKYGYTYGISSYFSENSFENGPWLVNFTVNPQNLNKAMPVVLKILKEYVKDGLSDKELQEEAKRLTGEYIIERMRTPHQLAGALAKYEILGLGAKFMDEYPFRMAAVTKKQANEALRKYIHPEKLLTVITGTLAK